jgi:mediator of RNA polymerase II transcription subunit 10
MFSNEVISHLSTLDEMAMHTSTMIPVQVLADIDNSRNPMQLTRDRLERAATENQFMNGKIAAIDVGIYLQEKPVIGY